MKNEEKERKKERLRRLTDRKKEREKNNEALLVTSGSRWIVNSVFVQDREVAC